MKPKQVPYATGTSLGFFCDFSTLKSIHIGVYQLTLYILKYVTGWGKRVLQAVFKKKIFIFYFFQNLKRIEHLAAIYIHGNKKANLLDGDWSPNQIIRLRFLQINRSIIPIQEKIISCLFSLKQNEKELWSTWNVLFIRVWFLAVHAKKMLWDKNHSKPKVSGYSGMPPMERFIQTVPKGHGTETPKRTIHWSYWYQGRLHPSEL